MPSHPSLCARAAVLGALFAAFSAAPLALSQDAPKKAPPSAAALVDDKKARALLDAGDARMEAGEQAAALDLYKAMIDRYPVSRWRFLAHLKIGKQYLAEKKFDLALDQFRRVSVEENKDMEQVGDAALQVGICYFEMGKFEEAFTELRKVIKQHPGSAYSNDAYYYIGQGHFKQGRFSNAIDAFKNVGTSIDPNTQDAEKLDIGKRLYVKIEDKDLAAQIGSAGQEAVIETTSGDRETVLCLPVAQGAYILMGSLRTQLGEPKPGNGVIELKGNDKIKVVSTDRQTAEAKLNVPRTKEISVVGNARVKIVDGAFEEVVGAVVLDKPAFLAVQDADRSLATKSDQIEVIVRTKRLVEEEGDAAAKKAADATAITNAIAEGLDRLEPVYRVISEKKITLVEKPAQTEEEKAAANAPAPAPVDPAHPEAAAPATAAAKPAAPAAPAAVHTGLFVGEVTIHRETETPQPGELVAQVGDLLEVEYLDEISLEAKPVVRKTTARAIEGNLNPLQVANAKINDEELKFKTALKTSEALKNIGNIYKDLGLTRQANDKYRQALVETEDVARSYGSLNQRLLEQTYVQMWKIYYAMEDLPRAAQMCMELQRRFPDSPFVDDALLLMGQVSQKQGKFQEAIGVYRRLAALPNSPQAPAAQYAVGECFEELGTTTKNKNYFDEAFLAFKICYDKFPNSNQAGDALSKMAEYYYSKEDYTRAIDIYEEALSQYQDSKFMDVVLYNYGRCLVKMKKYGEAMEKFNQLISSYPNSKSVANAQKLVEALQKRIGGGGQ